MTFHSIRWRTATAFVILILLCIIGLSIYLSNYLEHNYLDELEAQLTNQALLIGDTSRGYFADEQIEAIDSLTKRLGEQIDARITVIELSGVVVGDSEEDPATMENHADRTEVVEALTTGRGSSIRHSDTLGFDMIYVAIPIKVDGETVATSRVSLPLTEVKDSVWQVNRTITIGGLIAALIAIALALQISRITTEPLKKLTRMSKSMAEGKLDQEIRVSSVDEVGELSKAFNLMASRIKDMITLITAERDRMATILSNMSDGIIVVNNDSRIILVNAAAESMLNITGGTAVERTFVEAVRDYELNEIVQRCLQTREQQTGTVELRPDKLFLGIIVTPLEEEAGCLLLIQDLTELRRLENIRRDFVSNISHELRTPIASLKALNETLQEGAINDPTVSDNFLDKMSAETDKLAQMVEELGELSRIESGELPIQRLPFNIAEAINMAVSRLQAQAYRAGLSLSIDVPQSIPQVLGDRDRVEQVLLNLLHNAIKFTPSGGAVSISADPNDKVVRVSISDTGVGIADDDLPRVFERFYKADKARSGGGTGLGLAIAKHIIEAHGGVITVDSVEGKGTTFTFTLPSVA
jgi:two-component system phosphate regulon sensor histidine kinase PhoR